MEGNSISTAANPYRIPKPVKRAIKRLIPLALGIAFIPKTLVFYVCCGLVDVTRNRGADRATYERYFFSNGFFTWLLSPFNLLMDLVTLPFLNKGVYELADLPPEYQREVQAVIDAAAKTDVVGQIEAKVEGHKRSMVFFKWYGGNVPTSMNVPEFHQTYRFIRTIGVSVFNKKQSTDKHFGPFRATLRVLYNINDIHDRSTYIQVGHRVNYWQDKKLFIFDDTLEHQSFNETESIRYCLFVDILRPSYLPGVLNAVVTGIRLFARRFNFIFYRYWSFIKT